MKKIICMTLIGTLLIGSLSGACVAYGENNPLESKRIALGTQPVNMPDEYAAMIGDFPITMPEFEVEYKLAVMKVSKEEMQIPGVIEQYRTIAINSAAERAILREAVRINKAGLSEEEEEAYIVSVYEENAKKYNVSDHTDLDSIREAFEKGNPGFDMESLIKREIDKINVERLKGMQAKSIHQIFSIVYKLALKAWDPSIEKVRKQQDRIDELKPEYDMLRNLDPNAMTKEQKERQNFLRSQFDRAIETLLSLRCNIILTGTEKEKKANPKKNPNLQFIDVKTAISFVTAVSASKASEDRYWFDGITILTTGLSAEEKESVRVFGEHMLTDLKAGLSIAEINRKYPEITKYIQVKAANVLLSEQERNRIMKDRETVKTHIVDEVIEGADGYYILRFLKKMPAGTMIPVDCAEKLEAYNIPLKEQIFRRIYLDSKLEKLELVKNPKYFKD